MTTYPGYQPDVTALLDKANRGLIATGLSSQGLLRYALHPEAGVGAEPLDSADWGRCLAVYQAASSRLQERMRPVMDRWAAKLDAAADAIDGQGRDGSWKRPHGWVAEVPVDVAMTVPVGPMAVRKPGAARGKVHRLKKASRPDYETVCSRRSGGYSEHIPVSTTRPQDRCRVCWRGSAA